MYKRVARSLQDPTAILFQSKKTAKFQRTSWQAGRTYPHPSLGLCTQKGWGSGGHILLPNITFFQSNSQL